jgi:hypothetical protein
MLGMCNDWVYLYLSDTSHFQNYNLNSSQQKDHRSSLPQCIPIWNSNSILFHQLPNFHTYLAQGQRKLFFCRIYSRHPLHPIRSIHNCMTLRFFNLHKTDLSVLSARCTCNASNLRAICKGQPRQNSLVYSSLHYHTFLIQLSLYRNSPLPWIYTFLHYIRLDYCLHRDKRVHSNTGRHLDLRLLYLDITHWPWSCTFCISHLWINRLRVVLTPSRNHLDSVQEFHKSRSAHWILLCKLTSFDHTCKSDFWNLQGRNSMHWLPKNNINC